MRWMLQGEDGGIASLSFSSVMSICSSAACLFSPSPPRVTGRFFFAENWIKGMRFMARTFAASYRHPCVMPLGSLTYKIIYEKSLTGHLRAQTFLSANQHPLPEPPASWRLSIIPKPEESAPQPAKPHFGGSGKAGEAQNPLPKQRRDIALRAFGSGRAEGKEERGIVVLSPFVAAVVAVRARLHNAWFEALFFFSGGTIDVYAPRKRKKTKQNTSPLESRAQFINSMCKS